MAEQIPDIIITGKPSTKLFLHFVHCMPGYDCEATFSTLKSVGWESLESRKKRQIKAKLRLQEKVKFCHCIFTCTQINVSFGITETLKKDHGYHLISLLKSLSEALQYRKDENRVHQKPFMHFSTSKYFLQMIQTLSVTLIMISTCIDVLGQNNNSVSVV